MWKALMLLAAVLLGCGAPSVEPETEIGEIQQGYTIADFGDDGTGYGLYLNRPDGLGGQISCDWQAPHAPSATPPTTSICYFPNNKILQLNSSYWSAMQAEYYFWFEEAGVTNVDVAGAFASAITTYESITGWDVQWGTEVRHEITNGTGSVGTPSAEKQYHNSDFEYILRAACPSSGVFPEFVPYPAELRQCNSWRLYVDVETHAARTVATTAGLSFSFRASERYKHVRRLMVTSLLLASGLGSNGYNPKKDYLSFWLPAGMTTEPFQNNAINKNDKCQLDCFGVVNGAVNPIAGAYICESPFPPEY